ncbi:MAG: FtsX-like permease family protein [Candidatus Ranarchaeia archaeon]
MVSTKFLFSSLRKRWIPNLLLMFNLAVPTAINLLLGNIISTMIEQIGFQNTAPNILSVYLINEYAFSLFLQWFFTFIIAGITFWILGSTIADRRKSEIELLRKIGTSKNTVNIIIYTEIILIIIVGISSGLLIHNLSVPFLQMGLGIEISFSLIPFLITVFSLFTIIYVGSFHPYSSKVKLSLFNSEKKTNTIPNWLKQLSKYRRSWSVAEKTYRQFPDKHKKQIWSIIILFSVVTMALLSGPLMYFSLQRTIHETYKPNNRYVIGYSNTVNFFEENYLLNQTIFLDYSFEDQMINSTIVSQISNISNVEIEPRIILVSEIQEIPTISIEDDGSYRIIGQDRRGQVIAFGITPEAITNSWLSEGVKPEELTKDSVLVGDSTNQILFEEASLQNVRINSTTLPINGQVVDHFANGMTIYLHYETLETIKGIEGYNLLFIDLENISEEDFNNLNNTLSLNNLEILSLTSITEKNDTYLSFFYSPFYVVSLVSLLLTLISFSTLLIINLNNYYRDFVTMRSIGMTSKFTKKILSITTIIVLLRTLPFGVFIGGSLSYILITPQPYLPIPILSLIITFEILSILLFYLIPSRIMNFLLSPKKVNDKIRH